MMSIILYLPNKQGDYKETVVPKYVEEILFRRIKNETVPRVRLIGPYRFRMNSYNPQRPGYGLRADIEKLNAWTSRYFSPLEDIVFHEEKKNYYVEFTLYDPMAQQFERHGFIR